MVVGADDEKTKIVLRVKVALVRVERCLGIENLSVGEFEPGKTKVDDGGFAPAIKDARDASIGGWLCESPLSVGFPESQFDVFGSESPHDVVPVEVAVHEAHEGCGV